MYCIGNNPHPGSVWAIYEARLHIVQIHKIKIIYKDNTAYAELFHHNSVNTLVCDADCQKKKKKTWL